MTLPETKTQWQYLEKRPHPWRKQLYFTGKKLKAFDVWMDMVVNREDPNHPGILAIYRDADYSKNMSRQAIVRAIANE